jgi:hypothetical protein
MFGLIQEGSADVRLFVTMDKTLVHHYVTWSLEDDPREGRPTATTLETIEKVHNIVLDDRRV